MQYGGGYPGQSYNFYGNAAGALPMGQELDETPSGPDASGTATLVASEAEEAGDEENPSIYSAGSFDDMNSLDGEEEEELFPVDN